MTLAHTHRQLRQADPRPVPQQDPRGPALRRAAAVPAARTRSSTSSPTTTTTSPRPTSRPPTSTSRRTPRSTRTSRALRLRATSSLMEREDVVIVATVSAIYGLGDPVEYRKLMVTVRAGRAARAATPSSRELVRDPVRPQRRHLRAGHLPGARRLDRDLPGLRRAGDPDRALGRRGRADQQDQSAHRQHHRRSSTSAPSIPAKHFVTERATIERAVQAIRAELAERLPSCKAAGKLLEAQRLESRTNFDIEMLLEVGTCAGIENYSRHLSGRRAGRAPGLPARLLPGRLPGGGGRVARVAAADRRDVQRRPRPQADPGRVRLPAAVRARQPPAPVRRVHGAGAADDQRVGHAGRARAAALGWRRWSSRSSGPPAWSIPRWTSGRCAGQVDDLLHEIRLREARAASGCWSRRSPSGCRRT